MEPCHSQLLQELKRLIALQRVMTDPKVCKALEEMIADVLFKLRNYQDMKKNDLE